MNDRSIPDWIAAVVAAVFLILTALGSAKVMFVAGAIGLLVLLIVFPKDFLRGGALVATIGAVVGAVVALVMLRLLP